MINPDTGLPYTVEELIARLNQCCNLRESDVLHTIGLLIGYLIDEDIATGVRELDSTATSTAANTTVVANTRHSVMLVIPSGVVATVNGAVFPAGVYSFNGNANANNLEEIAVTGVTGGNIIIYQQFYI